MGFRDSRWLRQHIINLLKFYHPDCIDHIHGGYIPQLSDIDGHIYDEKAKHIVATCRFIHNFSLGKYIDGPDWCESAAEHGIRFLLNHFRDEDTGGFYWVLQGSDVEDSTFSCYGHVFVLLALSTARKAGIKGVEEGMNSVYDFIDEYFWEDEYGLCLSKVTEAGKELSSYRGQNANMHMCEAFISAYEITKDEEFLNRAYSIADSIAKKFPEEGDGLIWEHYTSDWEFDWEYNKDQPDDLFRPWGYQPGHLLEWAKLLMVLERYFEEGWLREKAEHFFRAAVENGWDSEMGGGFIYNFDREGEPIVLDKYFWELTEGFGAAALLGQRTGDDFYWEWYDKIWNYAWNNMVNRKHGNWYFKLTRENEVHEGIDQSPEPNAGYHVIGNCFEVMRELGEIE